MGPAVGDPTFFDWPWYYSVPSLALWGVLVMAIALPQANRTPHVILILIPVLAVRLIWSLLLAVAPDAGNGGIIFDMLVEALGVSIAIWWLTGHLVAERPWPARVLYAVAVSLVIALVGSAAYGLRSDPETIIAGGLFLCMVCALLGALVLTVLVLRRDWSPGRLLGFLALWTALTVQIGIWWFFITVTVLMGGFGGFVLQQLLIVIVVGLVAGAFMYAVNLPFVLLGVYHPFYRRRMTAFLSLAPDYQRSGCSVPSQK